MTVHEGSPGQAAPVVDARGTRCPQPVIRVARFARDLRAGSVVVLLADDAAARSDVPAWARLRGHTVTAHDEGAWTAYRVIVGGSGTQDDRST